MLVCGCGNWMHTEGVEERIAGGIPTWFIRLECRRCPSKNIVSAWRDDRLRATNKKGSGSI